MRVPARGAVDMGECKAGVYRARLLGSAGEEWSRPLPRLGRRPAGHRRTVTGASGALACQREGVKVDLWIFFGSKQAKNRILPLWHAELTLTVLGLRST